MKKTLKIIGIIISIPVVLFLIAAIVLASIDLNDYRTNIEQLVAENTGRQLTLKGDLKKSFFPWLGIDIGNVALSNAKGFQPADFASVEGVEVRIDTVSLLTMKPKVDRIIVKGLNLNLAKNKKGVSNWEDLSKPATSSQEPPIAAPTDAEEKQAPTPDTAALALINIAGITVQDANVSWVDDQAGANYSVKHVNLSVSEIALNQPLSLDLDFQLSSNEPNVNAKVILSSEKIEWNIETQRYAVSPLTIDINATGKVLPVSPLSTRLRIVADADLGKQTLNVSELKLSVLDVAVNAKASVDQLIDGPKYQSSLQIDKLNPAELLKKLGIELPPMKDRNVMSALTLNTSVKGDLNQVQVPELKLILDDTTVTANASVKNFARPSITAALEIDKMDLDRYLPPPADKPASESAPESQTAAAGKPEPLPIPVDLIRSLDVDANVKAGKIIVQQLDIDNVVVKARIKDGVANLSPVKLNLAQGTLQSDVSLDVKGPTPRYSVKQSIKGVQAAPLVKAVAGEDHVSGTLDLTADVNSQGMLIDEIMKTLGGALSFSFKDGAVKGFNLGEEIRKNYAKFKKTDYSPSETPKQTDFAELTGSAKINKGVVTNNDLSVKAPLLRVEGKGKVDLPAQSLDYLVTANIVETDEGQSGKEVQDLKGIPIPIKLSGTFDNIQWDYKWSIVAKALKDKLKKEVKKKVETKKQEIKQETKQKIEEKKEEKKEELKEKAKDKLKKLFKF